MLGEVHLLKIKFMIPKLYEHQIKIIKEDKHKCGLFLGTGASKTRTALELAEGSVLVICPKQQRDDQTWERENEKWGTDKKLSVISKEDLRKIWEELPYYDTVIIDECHNNLGVRPEYVQRKGIQIPATSQIFEATKKFLEKHPPKRLYLLSATPVPKPMAMWGIGILLGQNWDFYKFRQVYYTEVRVGGTRRIWMVKRGEEVKQRLADLIKRFGYTGAISDFVDVPDQIDKTVYIDLSTEQKKALQDLQFREADALVRASRARTIENGVLYGKKIEELDGKIDQMTNFTTFFKSNKIDYILERAQEFSKLLLFVNYTAQIEEIARTLRQEGYKVYTLTGSTKDRSFIKKVDESDEPCIIIAQSSVSAGWEAPSFPCVIFVSLSWRVVDHIQARGRVLRMNKLKKNLYIYLIVKGGKDDDCYKAIMSGNDFIEKMNSNAN